MRFVMIAAGGVIALCVSLTAQAQVNTIAPEVISGAKPVTVQRIKIRSAALAGNLEGNNADRDVLVMLPPSYASEPQRRYPVIYALHGYSIGAEQWTKEIHAPASVEGAFAKGAGEMIVVFPDSKTAHNGSFYSRSPTTGDFETFIARDVVNHIDANYRTLARRESRGLVGHSMGGYGATRIGMKHSDVFGALYIMSGCCLSPRGAGPANPELAKQLAEIKSVADAAKLPWIARAGLATASAWSPNPNKAPLYMDLPGEDAKANEEIVARWTANAPLAFFDQHVGDLRRHRAIFIDVGDKDGLKDDAAKLHGALNRYKIAHGYDVYSGDHTSHIGVRFQENVLPFFSKNLAFR